MPAMQQVSSGGHSKLASHGGGGDAAQPGVIPTTDGQIEPSKRKPRQSYPVPIDAGGRGVSAWARGAGGGLGAEGDPPHFQGVGGEEAGAARRRNRESKVDSPAVAAARAAAVYELPALRETGSGAHKRGSHQVGIF